MREVLKLLDTISPFELQERWDNSGLQVGDKEMEVTHIYTSIDIDEELIDSLEPRSLLITHHPLIFSALKSLELRSYPAKLVAKLIKKEIALVAMHTNFDKTHLNSYVARLLGASKTVCEGFVCYFDKKMDFAQALEWVQERLDLQGVRYVQCSDRIERVALTTGSGGSLLDSIEADLFLTGDLKYHDAMKAKALGISVIDIGHYESERYFAPLMAEELKKYQIEAIIAQSKNPLHYKGGK